MEKQIGVEGRDWDSKLLSCKSKLKSFEGTLCCVIKDSKHIIISLLDIFLGHILKDTHAFP